MDSIPPIIPIGDYKTLEEKTANAPANSEEGIDIGMRLMSPACHNNAGTRICYFAKAGILVATCCVCKTPLLAVVVKGAP